MKKILLAAGAVAVGIGTAIMSKPAKASEVLTFDDIFKKYGRIYGVDWKMIKAHVMVESSMRAEAINPSDPSYGLGQVLCKATGPDQKCTNVFYVDGWHEATPNKLLDPDFNIRIVAQIIAKNIRQYGFPRAVAVYNSFDQHKAPLDGPFKNQRYVDKVLNVYSDLQLADQN